jgi:hypothetical protein
MGFGHDLRRSLRRFLPRERSRKQIGYAWSVPFEEAYAMYMQARSYRAHSGFVHSFTPGYYGDGHYEYQNGS